MQLYSYLLAAILAAQLPVSTHAHGRMLAPASRTSGYLSNSRMPPNFNDHEMNCGGRIVQWDQNHGKCGLCGEPYSGPQNYKRPNGIMVQELFITANYTEGQTIVVRLQITAFHLGYHMFLICNIAQTGGVEATQECLNKTPLADETGATKFTKGTTSTGMFDYYLVLPIGFTCDHCMLQWKWHCGNDWGCDGGGCGLNHGERQEEFYSCADVAIYPRNSRITTSKATTTTTTTTTTTPLTTTQKKTTTTEKPTRAQPTTTTPTTTTTSTTTTTTRKPPPTTTTTTRKPPATTPPPTTTTTTRKPPATTPRFYFNVVDEFFKKKNRTDAGGIRNSGHSSPKSNIPNWESFMNTILGRNSEIIQKDGLAIPMPKNENTTSSTDDVDFNTIARDPQTMYRFCAACMYIVCIDDRCKNCPYNNQCASTSSRKLG